MRYVEAPEVFLKGSTDELVVFLAGGITGCPDWQKDMVRLMHDTDAVLVNPRRENFPMHDPSAARAQIEWEHNHLRKADVVSFWFPKETLCPITLYELGSWTIRSVTSPTRNRHPRIVIGVEDGYARRQDVLIQTGLADPFIPIVFSIGELVEAVITVLGEIRRAREFYGR